MFLWFVLVEKDKRRKKFNIWPLKKYRTILFSAILTKDQCLLSSATSSSRVSCDLRLVRERMFVTFSFQTFERCRSIWILTTTRSIGVRKDDASSNVTSTWKLSTDRLRSPKCPSRKVAVALGLIRQLRKQFSVSSFYIKFDFIGRVGTMVINAPPYLSDDPSSILTAYH